jgi:hypothetical protein
VGLYIHYPIRLHGVVLNYFKHRDNVIFFTAPVAPIFSFFGLDAFVLPVYEDDDDGGVDYYLPDCMASHFQTAVFTVTAVRN